MFIGIKFQFQFHVKMLIVDDIVDFIFKWLHWKLNISHFPLECSFGLVIIFVCNFNQTLLIVDDYKNLLFAMILELEWLESETNAYKQQL